MRVRGYAQSPGTTDPGQYPRMLDATVGVDEFGPHGPDPGLWACSSIASNHSPEVISVSSLSRSTYSPSAMETPTLLIFE